MTADDGNPTLKFNNGNVAPAFGFGTWLSKPGEVGEAVKIALETGYTHIDCAHVYGNEAEIGDTFTSVMASGQVKRENIFVTSKLWVKDFGNVKEACKLTLKNLQLEYLDLYLIHVPFEVDHKLDAACPTNGVGLIGYDPQRINEVWKAMEELVEEGLVKAIGVSNFTIPKLKKLLNSAKIIPACNQIELHPYLPQEKMIDYCKENGITLVAYSPLANPGRPADFKDQNEPYLLGDDTVAQVAKKHDASNAQILLVWAIKRGTGVIPKSVNADRIKENFACLKIKLDEEDMKKLNGIETRFRYCKEPWARAPSQTFDEIWDNELLG